MYSLYELVKYISLDDIPSSWKNCYEDITKKYYDNWLDKYNFDLILSYYEFDDNFKERFFKEINLLKKASKLNFICYIMYYILFLADFKNYYNIWSWKSTKNVFKNNGSYMINVVSLLCGYEFHIKNMELRNFDDKQIEMQKYNIRLTCTNDTTRYNIDGIRFSQMIWGSFFMKGNLIQVGRLQYEIGVLNFDKLDKYFKEKHKYIYIHIPRDNNLSEDDVNDSLNRAVIDIKRFYPSYRNEKLAFFTNTWLLSPELKYILAVDSNIMKFQNRFKIIEYEECTKDFLNFVFDIGIENVEYENLKEETTLQKGLKKKLINGDKLHLGLGILNNNFLREGELT